MPTPFSPHAIPMTSYFLQFYTSCHLILLPHTSCHLTLLVTSLFPSPHFPSTVTLSEHITLSPPSHRAPTHHAFLLVLLSPLPLTLTPFHLFCTCRAEYDCFQIELSKNYGVQEWRDDVKNVLLKAGLECNQMVFLFSDTQVRWGGGVHVRMYLSKLWCVCGGGGVCASMVFLWWLYVC